MGTDTTGQAAAGQVAGQTTGQTAADQAAADAIAAQAAGAAGAVKTAEQIATEAAAAQAQQAGQYTLALPKDAVIEAEAMERLTAFAKANTLSHDAAQHALDHVNAEVAADRARQGEAHRDAFKVLAFETWPNDVKADKEFGGEKFDATVTESKRATDRFVTKEEKEILNTTGWGNHPLLVKIMARVGRALSNDTLVTGAGGSEAGQKSTAEMLYGSTQPK